MLDWRTAFRFQASTNEYATLDMPSLIVRGGLANEAMVEITHTLIASLPDCRSAIVEGAGHFFITSHAQQCANLLSDFLSDVTH